MKLLPLWVSLYLELIINIFDLLLAEIRVLNSLSVNVIGVVQPFSCWKKSRLAIPKMGELVKGRRKIIANLSFFCFATSPSEDDPHVGVTVMTIACYLP